MWHTQLTAQMISLNVKLMPMKAAIIAIILQLTACTTDTRHAIEMLWYKLAMHTTRNVCASMTHLHNVRLIYSSKNAQQYFFSILSMDRVIMFLGMMLNFMVCIVYFSRRAIRSKLPNVLLLNQAFADLFTCMVYILPNIVFQIILTIHKTKKYHYLHDPIRKVITFASITSSILIYSVAAFERWLSIATPLWHRVNLKTQHIWNAVRVIWLISIGSSLPAIFVDKTYVIYYRSMQGLMVLFVVAISILFITTWYKAIVEVRRHHQLGSDSNGVTKELQITKIFALMYLLFIMNFTPLATANPNIMSPERRIKILLFELSTMINPILTMTLKRDFRICWKPAVGNGHT